MPLFGEHLRTILESNKINVFALAKQAGLERTTIHKIMTDGRIPSADYVHKLADALPLTPVEKKRFLESYGVFPLTKPHLCGRYFLAVCFANRPLRQY